MQHKVSVNFGNLILSLSDAVDLASPLLAKHQQRTAFIAWEMGMAAGFSAERLEKGFLGALIHDIGAFTLEEKLSLNNIEFENREEHCIRSYKLLNNVPWLKDTAQIIKFHHRKLEEWELSNETPLVLDSQLLFLADSVERLIDKNLHVLHQNEDIILRIKSLVDESFHPDIVDIFLKVADHEEFWLNLDSPRLYSLLLNSGPFRNTETDISKIAAISELFRNIIDFRSRYTAAHSTGVAAAASILSQIFGLTKMETMLIEVAGNLHDIGKLAIPDSILDKPDKLTKRETALIKSHTYYTYTIINTIGGLQQVAEWAAYHHERLDGSGYPFHCKGYEISTSARILMVADIFTALIEERPYRNGMNKDGIVNILKELADCHLLDARIINLLFDNFDEIATIVSEKQKIAMTSYEYQYAPIKKQ